MLGHSEKEFRGQREWETRCGWTSASLFVDLEEKRWPSSTLTSCFVGCCNQQLYRWCSWNERYVSATDPHTDSHAFVWLWNRVSESGSFKEIADSNVVRIKVNTVFSLFYSYSFKSKSSKATLVSVSSLIQFKTLTFRSSQTETDHAWQLWAWIGFYWHKVHDCIM